MNDPRRHHYVSQGYLRGFTTKKGKKKKLWTLDFKTKKQFSPSPANVAAQRDYNRVEIDGLDPNVFEKSFAKFEDDAISSIRKLENTLDFTGETKKYIINLIAFYYSRSPRLRERFREMHEDLNRMMLKSALATPERWESVVSDFNRDRPDLSYDFPYDEMLKYADSETLKLNLRKEYHIFIELKMIENLVVLLFERNWVLVQTHKESGPFVTSDDPVFIDYRNPKEIPPLLRNSPGFGARGTVVLFPVTQNLLLSGDFEEPPGIARASRELVAQLNSAQIRRAARQIYAPSEHFVYFDKDQIIRDGRFLHEFINRKA